MITKVAAIVLLALLAACLVVGLVVIAGDGGFNSAPADSDVERLQPYPPPPPSICKPPC